VFSGPLQGLVLCEVASAVEAEVGAFVPPAWARIEVTSDPFFFGAALAFATPDQLRARLAGPRT
jgi:CYTH domain-containing protein